MFHNWEHLFRLFDLGKHATINQATDVTTAATKLPFQQGDSRNSQTTLARRARIHVCFIVIATSFVFSNTLHNGIHFDSAYRVGNNPEIEFVWPPWRHFLDRRTGSTLPQIAEYRPMLPLSFSLTVALGDLLGIERLVGHHLGNLAVHLATSIFVYLLFRELLVHWSELKLSQRRLLDTAFAATLIFAIHPVSGVPVNYLAARDLLMMMFFLTTSLLVYIRMRRSGDSLGAWMLSLGLAALSVFSKQNGGMLAALVMLFEVSLARSSLRSLATWCRPVAFGAVLVGYFLCDRLVVDTSATASGYSWTPALVWTYTLTQFRLHLSHYLFNFIWPFELRPLPLIDTATGPFEPGVIAGALLIGVSLVAAGMFWRRTPLASSCLLGYWILFVPSSLVPIRPMVYLAIDYRQYPSLPFLCLLLVMGIVTVMSRWKMVRALSVGVFVVLLAYFGSSSYQMNRVWRSEESLWGHSVRYGAESIAHLNYARSIQHRDADLAEHHYLEAIRMLPGNVYAHINLGLLYMRLSQLDKGLAYLEQAVSLRPDWAMTHYWLAEGYRQLGRSGDSVAERRTAADLDPRNIDYQYQAALAVQTVGDYSGSLAYLQRVAEFRQGYELTLFLQGFALQKLGHWREAEQKYREFVAQRPKYAPAWFNLGRGLMTAGQHQEAIDAFHKVLQLSPERFRSVHHWLSVSYARLGDTENAQRHAAIANGE